MNSRAITSAIVLALLGGACNSKPDGTADPSATAALQSEGTGTALASFTDTDLDKLERGLRKEIEAVEGSAGEGLLSDHAAGARRGNTGAVGHGHHSAGRGGVGAFRGSVSGDPRGGR